MQWNTTISIGDLFTVVAFIVTLYAFHIKNIERFAKIETKVNLMWSQLKNRLNISDEDDE